MKGHISDLVAAYLFGIFLGNLIFLFWSGPLVLAVLLASLIIGAFFLIVGAFLFAIFRLTVLANLRLFCLSVPVLVVASWAMYLWISHDAEKLGEFGSYLVSQNVWPQGAFALTCSYASAATFFGLSRRRLSSIVA